MITAGMIFLGLFQALVMLLAAPLLSGLSRVLRAKMHNRRGPSLFQNYRDLAKLMKRQQVIPEQAGWVFRATPYLIMVAMLLIAAMLPIFTDRSPFNWAGDLILVVYLYALARFFFSLSGLDSGSPFGGIGGRRELLISVLVEPGLLLVLFVMALLAGSTSLGVISTGVATGRIPYYTSVWLGMLAFAFASFVEMGKLPFDLAEAEQELQEGPLTEFSGHALALMKWGIYLRQAVLVAFFLAIFLPFGSVTDLAFGLPLLLRGSVAVVAFFLKVIACYFLMALVENAMARVRFLKAPAVIWTALGAAVLSFVFYLANV
jgi:hydrogenase-4 component C